VSNRSGNVARSFAKGTSQNHPGKKQTIQNALIQGKIPMSIVSQMPKWRLTLRPARLQ